MLQFIFDRVKKDDLFKLNQIFSHTKKLRQNIRDNKSIEVEKEKLKNSLSESKLPKQLKSKPNFNSEDIFKQNTFLHLVCKYYKLRQKAKAGRFEEKNHLLVHCNHKPRRKKHQTFEDLSSILQVSSKKLREKVGVSDKNFDDKLIKILKDMPGLSRNCDKIAKQQKERRGFLKLNINTIYYSVSKAKQENIKKELTSSYNKLEKKYQNKPASSLKQQEEKLTENILKQLTQTKRVKDAKDLYKLCEKSKELYIQILKELDLLSNDKEQDINKNLKRNPSIAFYLLAQINNIAFKERNGNASTCPVCSRDNSERMQIVPNKSNMSAKANRLPAIPNRMIDGAVMRMTRIITKAIAEEKWKDIKTHLKKHEKVRIPIITESNQFEFEPSREELVKTQRKNSTRIGKVLDQKEGFDLFEKDFKDKEARIKSLNKICPYTDEKINIGEIDHIIPRKSKYGTLNDEANLMWASLEGNDKKDKNQYSLSKLMPKYKEKLFKLADDIKIKEWIKDKIWDENTQDFKFGKYTSFININSEEQKAFKHALFLVGDPIRDKVIQAIDNRNRAFVNGTQRYFAEVLANELYKKAKKEKLDHLLSFDYFSISAQDIYEARKCMKKIKNKEGNLLHPELEEYKKTKDKSQKSYSHLIDAQIAFVSLLSKHYNEGSFKLKADSIDIFEDYKKIKVLNEEFNKKALIRQTIKPKDKKIAHRGLFNSNAGAWHFLKLIEIKIDDSSYYLKGFLDFQKLRECLNKRDWSKIQKEIKKSYHYNNMPIAQLLEKQKEKELLVKLYEIGEKGHQFGYQKNGKYPKIMIEKKWDSHSKESPSPTVIKVFLHQIDKTKVAEFLLKNFNTKSDPKTWKDEDCQVLDHLTKIWYHTKKNKIESDSKDDIREAINIISNGLTSKEKQIKKSNFTFHKLFNPSLFYAWSNLSHKWNQFNGNDKDFLKEHFKDETSKHDHKKVRKSFSLPLGSSGQGWFLVKRKIWDKNKYPYIYQCLSEENKNISKFGSHKDSLKDILLLYFRKDNLFLFPKSGKKSKDLKDTLSSVDNIIDPDTYYEIKIPDDLKNILKKIENKTGQSIGRADFRFHFKQKFELNIDFIKLIKEFPTRKIKDKVKNHKDLFDRLIKKYSKYSEKQIDIQSKLIKVEEDLSKIQDKLKTLDGEEKEKLKNEKILSENKRKFYFEIKSLYDKINKNILEYQANKPFSKT